MCAEGQDVLPSVVRNRPAPAMERVRSAVKAMRSAHRRSKSAGDRPLPSAACRPAYRHLSDPIRRHLARWEFRLGRGDYGFEMDRDSLGKSDLFLLDRGRQEAQYRPPITKAPSDP